MSELYDDEEKELITEDAFVDTDEAILNSSHSISDARRRLESLLDEKRLKDELEDFLDY